MRTVARRSKSVALLWMGALLGMITPIANAVPAFARQTGQNCVACHVSFPELTPYGRWFKLSGYTIGTRQAIPVAAMAQHLGAQGQRAAGTGEHRSGR